MKKREFYELKDLHRPDTRKAEVTAIIDVVNNPYTFETAASILTAQTFASDDTRNAWDVISQMHESNEEYSVLDLFGKIEAGLYEELLNNTGIEKPSSKAKDDFRSLKEMSAKAKFYDAIVPVLIGITKTSMKYEEIEERLKAAFEDVSTSVALQDPAVTVPAAMQELRQNIIDNAELREKGHAVRNATGISTLDLITNGGFARGQLVIMAARPGVGKTAMTLQMAKYMSLTRNIPSAFFSLEMTSDELAARLLMSESNLTSYDIAQGRAALEDVDGAIAKFKDIPMLVNDRTFNANAIINYITKYHRRGMCEVAFIDYLGLIETSQHETKALEIAYTTRKFKQLAKELQIPIVLLCQMNRKIEETRKEPQLSDLRDSGAIEQDADIVMMLQEIPEEKSRTHERMVRMFIRKNRQGEKDVTIDFTTNKTYTVFTEDRGGNDRGQEQPCRI